MKILMVGAGDARDHATFARLRREEADVSYALLGGNALLLRSPGVVPVASVADAIAAAQSRRPDLIVIQRPELLLDGVPDLLREDGHTVLGVGAETSVLEGSKVRCKEFLACYGVPTPDWSAPGNLAAAQDELKSRWQDGIREYVVKSNQYVSQADLRSAVPQGLADALSCLDRLARVPVRDRGPNLLLEQRVHGQELSLHVLLDGETSALCPPVSDYKTLHDGDVGPNTHGMGAIAASWARSGLRDLIESQIVRPVVSGLRAAGLDYRGVLYLGLMITEDGPQVLEINVRPGNPEWIALLGLLETPLVDLMFAMAAGTLGELRPRWRSDAVSGVAFATVPGYPGEHALSQVPVRVPLSVEMIGEGIRAIDSLVAGVGRSYCVSAVGPTVAVMRDRLYAALGRTGAQELHFRTDIGFERPFVTGDL